MPISQGSHIGPYEIAEPLGAGGMGEVYRARDPKLNRDVALKVLPEAVARDAERLARFRREARVLAALNHPNIAHIHGLEDSADTPALVLELVEGPTLAGRIARSALPVDEALAIGRQIAAALEAAHEQGIVHRDLKPANVKITPDGEVKVLDFGLAKAIEGSTVGRDVNPADPAESPTVSRSAAATRLGAVLGTPAYMSPEQARGHRVDRRADIWAFGVVLYELLTGVSPFRGEDSAQTLARIVEREPDWTRLPALPTSVLAYLRRCLHKNPRERVRDIGDVRLALEGAFDTASTPTDTPAEAASSARAWWDSIVMRWGAVVALVTLGWAAATIGRPSTPATPAEARVARFALALPPEQRLTGSTRGSLAISPDGSRLAYTANDQLWIRAMDSLTPTVVPGTDGAESPFFSPDGAWLGFFADGRLQRVQVDEGGSPVPVTDVDGPTFGVHWAFDDTILFNVPNRGISRVAAHGGPVELVVPVDDDQIGLPWPQLLPGGEWILFVRFPARQVVVQSLTSGDRHTLVDGAAHARYVPSGHLLSVRDGVLFVAPFEPGMTRLTDQPRAVLDGVRHLANSVTHLAVSDSGSLVFLPSTGSNAGERTLAWVGRDGREEPLAAPPAAYVHPRLSPDGTRLAVSAYDRDEDIWIWDFSRETMMRLTTAPGRDADPVWTPDGRRVVFSSRRDGRADIYWKPADGSDDAVRVTDHPESEQPHAFMPDGRRLVYGEVRSDEGIDLAAIEPDGGSPETLIATGAINANAAPSPDGRWLAYQSDVSGRSEVYLRPLPGLDEGRWQASSEGGAEPRWRRDGRELYYRTRSAIMAVEVDTTSTVEIGRPEAVVDARPYLVGVRRTYDVSAEGERFLVIREHRGRDAGDSLTGLDEIHVVLDWTALIEPAPGP